MNKFEETIKKIDELEEEFYILSSLYNLHIIELKSIYSHAILEAYSSLLKDDYNVATLIKNNQILFYYTAEKKYKTVNISEKMFHKIWKIFIKKIEKVSIKHSSNEYYEKLKNSDFINVVIEKTTGKVIYFKEKNITPMFSKNLVFAYKPQSKEEKLFILKNKEIWIPLSRSAKHKIKQNTDLLSKQNQRIVVNVDLFSADFAHKILNNLLEKIATKSNNKLKIKIISRSRDKKLITLSSNIFIPLSFIEYIREYLFTNTLYGLRLVDAK